MPRKPNATNATASTKLTSRQKTRAHVAFQSIDSKAGLGDEIEDDTDDVVINGDDENGMMEMLTMLQEFQKRKASKTSSRATVFHNKKNALFTDARKNVDAVVRDGMAYIDQCLAKISELKAQETSQENNFKDLSRLWENHDEIIQNLLGTYPTIIEDLSHRRAEQINEASAMLEEHIAERQRSRRRLILNAKAHMDENLEKQKLATDATALIKHYKSLLLS